MRRRSSRQKEKTMTEQAQQIPANLNIALPVADMLFLLRAASGATMRRDQWQRLETIDNGVAEAIQQVQQVQPPKTVQPPFDPNTADAAAKREARAAKRKAQREAQAKTSKPVGDNGEAGDMREAQPEAQDIPSDQ